MNLDESAAPNVRQTRQEQVLMKHLQGKEKEWASIADREQPLQLLDLPVDVLQSIIKEITHTNDLTSLALTHSALHTLVIPHIYSRFDIVWPDTNTEVDTRVGVDALTYGLNTLVMDHDVLGEIPAHRISSHPLQQCANCGKLNQCAHNLQPFKRRRIRRGNYFAQYTRKFSLGNGPPEWVQDYAITKEAGKMLGTLIALAVGRMRNLEAFIFDMPTGVLRDVWLALASLEDRDDGKECRLEQVWVRWHDNSDPVPLGPSSTAGPIPTLMQPTQGAGVHSTTIYSPPVFNIPAYPRVEFPTFSVLPSLKSLSVLDIDELPYAEEMSVLVERSVARLQELRIGVAQHAQFSPWVRPLEDGNHVRPPVGTSMDQISRPGGLLGILVSRICNVFGSTSGAAHELDSKQDAPFGYTGPTCQAKAPGATDNFDISAVSSNHLQPITAVSLSELDGNATGNNEEAAMEAHEASEIGQLTTALVNHHLHDDPIQQAGGFQSQQPPKKPTVDGPKRSTATDKQTMKILDTSNQGFKPSKKLKLEILELERVPLSVLVLSKAIDWSRLTSLTLLGCRGHEQLWKALRKRFGVSSNHPKSSVLVRSSTSSTSNIFTPNQLSASTPRSNGQTPPSYALKIRRLHTDTVSSAFLAFVHAALKPATLTHLFLQASPGYKSSVTISQIYRLAIRHHRPSLRKLLIDSSLRSLEDLDNPAPPDTNHLQWLYPRELLATIMSPKMHLRELSLSLSRDDWHFFLQHLTNATGLRSLHIARITERARTGQAVALHRRESRPSPVLDERETALHILDIVALRPQLELCYLAVGSKCFEVLEYDSTSAKKNPRSASAPFVTATDGVASSGDDADSETDSSADDPVGATDPNAATDPEADEDSSNELGSAAGAESTEDDEDENDESLPDGTKKKTRVKTFKLREILFFDDKISIFKARHGRL